MSVLRLATRRSPLALLQAKLVQARSASARSRGRARRDRDERGHANSTCRSRCSGARASSRSRSSERCLRDEADVAVHSAKDLPSESPEGLMIACVPERLDPSDVLVGRSLAGLGPGATVATGSPRRRALLLERRPDLRVVELRGNMATRLSTPGSNGVTPSSPPRRRSNVWASLISSPSASTPRGSCPRWAKAP